jgi:hypothetical protein
MANGCVCLISWAVSWPPKWRATMSWFGDEPPLALRLFIVGNRTIGSRGGRGLNLTLALGAMESIAKDGFYGNREPEALDTLPLKLSVPPRRKLNENPVPTVVNV